MKSNLDTNVYGRIEIFGLWSLKALGRGWWFQKVQYNPDVIDTVANTILVHREG